MKMLSSKPIQKLQMRTRNRLTPEQRILAVLRTTKEITARELITKANVHNSKIYLYLKQLEKEGRVMHHYRVGTHDRKLVKYYILLSRS